MKNNNKTLAKILLTILLAGGGGMLNAWSQTIFSNPVGIGVGSVTSPNYLEVDGPIRFQSLSTGLSITSSLVADGSGNLSFSNVHFLPAATAYGKFLMSDNSTPNLWTESNIIRVNGVTNSVFQVGDLVTPLTAGLPRTQIFGGGLNVYPFMGLGVTAPADHLRMGPTEYTISSVNLTGVAAVTGLGEYGGFYGLSGNNALIAFLESNAGATPNRLVFSRFSRAAPGATTATETELMTLLHNGNFGVGISNPDNLFHLHKDATDNSMTITSNLTGTTTYDDGVALGINSVKNGYLNNKEEGGIEFLTDVYTGGLNTVKVEIQVDGKVKIDPHFEATSGGTGTYNQTTTTRTLLNLNINEFNHHVYQNFTNKTTLPNHQDGFRIGLDASNNAILNMQEDADMIFYTHGASTTAQYLNDNERVRIKNDGKIGINVSNPVNLLDVKGNAVFGTNYAGSNSAPTNGVLVEGAVVIGTTTSAGSNKLAVAGTTIIGTSFTGGGGPADGLAVQGNVGIGTASAPNPLTLNGAASIGGSYTGTAAPTNGLIVEGDMGIGTSSPANKFTLNGAASIGSSYTSTTAPTNGLIVEGFVGIGTSTPAYELDIVGDINVTGAGYSGSGGMWGISDRRLKKNINDISSALTLIKRLNGKTYNFDSEMPICRNTNGLFSGFIAQELQEVIPLAVKEKKDGYLAVNYDAIIPYIVEAIKEQDQKIEAITTPQNSSLKKMEDLQQQLDSLKKIVLALSIDKANTSKETTQLKQELTLNDAPKLLQNQPNPFSTSTIIYYYLPANSVNSFIKVFDATGKLINSYKLTNTGYAHVEVKAGDIAQGSFTYTLEVNNQQVDSKKMILARD